MSFCGMSFVAKVRFHGCRWVYLATIVSWDEQIMKIGRCIAVRYRSSIPCRRKAAPRYTQRNEVTYARDLIESCERSEDWVVDLRKGYLGPSEFCVSEGGRAYARCQKGNVVSGNLYLPDHERIWIPKDDRVVEQRLGQETSSNKMFWYCLQNRIKAIDGQ